jgi:hypothetical protein
MVQIWPRTHLSEIKLCVLLSGDTLDLDEGCVGSGVAFGTLVAEDTSFRVESTKFEGLSMSADVNGMTELNLSSVSYAPASADIQPQPRQSIAFGAPHHDASVQNASIAPS